MRIEELQQISTYPLGFGGASISGEGRGYGMGAMSAIEAEKILQMTFERGIRLYDTAPIYGFGESEKRIGKAFKSLREKVFYLSKSGVHWHANKRVDMNNDPAITEKMLHESLKRLDTDYIDLYMIHWPDTKWDIRKPMEVLAKAMEQDKILAIGLCNTNDEDFAKACEIAPISAVQSECNPFTNHFLKYDFTLPVTMGWGSLDKGILTGRVKEDTKYDSDDCRKSAPWFRPSIRNPRIKAVAELNLGSEDLLAMALSYSHHYVNFSLCGGKSIQQWESLLAVFDRKDHLRFDEFKQAYIKLGHVTTY